MATKCIDKTLEVLTEFNKNCCGCPQIEGSYYPSSNPYISYRVDWNGMLNYSPTQWIIPIEFQCGCLSNSIPGGGTYLTNVKSKVHNIKVVGTNPANVSFAYLSNVTLNGNFPTLWGGNTYSRTAVTGWCMIVDKDPANVMQAKSSGIGGVTIEVQKCSTSTPFSFQLFTENFFSWNFKKNHIAGGATCNSTPPSSSTPFIRGITSGNMVNTSSTTFYDGTVATSLPFCLKDNGTYFSAPISYSNGCMLSSMNFQQVLKTMQSITVLGCSEPMTWGTGAGVWFTYNGALGAWMINVDKNPGGTYHVNHVANPSIQTTIDVEIVLLEDSDPCNVADPSMGFSGQLKTSTHTVFTLALNEFFTTNVCPF